MDREEIIQRRLNRVKGKKTTRVAFTPFPISSRGPLEYMFPVEGEVRKLVVYVDEMPKGGVDIIVEIGSTLDSVITKFKTKGMFIKDLIPPIGEVDVGDKFIVTVEPTELDEDVGYYWVSALWVPYKSSVDVVEFLEDSDAGETT